MGILNDKRMCVDRVLPQEKRAAAAVLAIKENKANRPSALVLPTGASISPFKMAILAGKAWKAGQRKLTVSFKDGTATQKSRVQEHAMQWMDHCGIVLKFKQTQDAEIRISFKYDGSWSYVGTDCLSIPASQPTMNYGWLLDDSDDAEYNRVVLHEFGHAIGAIHEHQNPFGQPIQWNVNKVYQYFSGPPNNWTKEDIDVNILQKYSMSQINGTNFDRQSIMLYSFPPELIVGGQGTPHNTKLSVKDKEWAAHTYPKPAGAASKAKSDSKGKSGTSAKSSSKGKSAASTKSTSKGKSGTSAKSAAKGKSSSSKRRATISPPK
jgi:hypothetical protein